MNQIVISWNGVMLEITETDNGVSMGMSARGDEDSKVITMDDFVTSFITLFFVFSKMQRNWFVKYLVDNVDPNIKMVPIGEFKSMCNKALADTIKSIGDK